MAKIVVISSELMLGTRIEATLTASGHDVRLANSLTESSILDDADLVVADVGHENPEALVGLGYPVLGYYQHTDVATREAAEAAGVDIVVPRSRLVREMPELVEKLLAEPRQ
ncbi:MAG: hypothetical protein ACR2OC_05610 [Solirubrobacterales bacterium]